MKRLSEEPSKFFEEKDPKRSKISNVEMETDISLEFNEKPHLPGNNRYVKHYVSERVFSVFEANGEKLDGKYLEYFPSQSVKIEGFFTNGMKTGTWREFHRNNELKSISEYNDNELNGKFKCYFSSGHIESEGSFLKGKKVGTWKEYFRNGNIRSMGKFKNNLRNGFWKFYAEKGFEIETGEFLDDIKVGEWKEFTGVQKVISIKNYKNGKYNGKVLMFSRSGKPIQTRNYSDGILNGKFRDYHRITFCLSVEMEIKNGFFIGDQRIYFPNGGLSIKISSIEMGPISEGDLRYSSIYWNKNILSCFVEFFDENGKIRGCGKYVFGKRDKEWKFFDSTLETLIVNYPGSTRKKITFE